MKKYTLYLWRTADDGGYEVCASDEEPCGDESVTKIGEFDTISELTDLLHKDDPEWFDGSLHTAATAMEMMNTLWSEDQ